MVKLNGSTVLASFYRRELAMHLASRSANGRTHVNTSMSAPFVEEATQCLAVLKRQTCQPSPLQRNTLTKAWTPVKLARMQQWLNQYTNRPMAQLIEDGFNSGFKVPPFEGTGCEWVENLKSVNLHPGVVSERN